MVLVDYLGWCAKQDVLCHPDEVRRDFGALLSMLRRVFWAVGVRDITVRLFIFADAVGG